MLGLVNTPNGKAPVELRELPEPQPARNEALVAVRAFSINRGELALLKTRTNQWRPGQDVAGVVVEPAADGSGPPPGSRVVALVEEAGWAELAAVPTARLAPGARPGGRGRRRCSVRRSLPRPASRCGSRRPRP